MGAKKFPLVTQIYLKRTCKPLYTASILARYFAWAIDQLHIKIHPGQLYPLGSIGPGKERTYTPLAHSLVGPIGPGRVRVHSAHSPPSGTNWSRKEEIALCSLSSPRDQLVQEGRGCTILTLLPPGPIGPGRERVTMLTLFPAGPIGPGRERVCYSHSPPSGTN